MANNSRSTDKERYWRGILERWGQSGLAIREFCRQRQLSEPSFYAWRRELAQRDATSSTHNSSANRIDASNGSPRHRVPERLASERDASPRQRAAVVPAFVPIRLESTAGLPSTPDCVLELAGGRCLRLPSSLSPEWWATFVQALEATTLTTHGRSEFAR